MKDYIANYVALVVDEEDFCEAMPEEGDVVLLTYSEMYNLIQMLKQGGMNTTSL